MATAVGPRVALQPVVTAADRALIERLYPLYLHDLSPFTEYYDLDSAGRWVPDHLPTWLGSDRCSAFLVTADGRLDLPV